MKENKRYYSGFNTSAKTGDQTTSEHLSARQVVQKSDSRGRRSFANHGAQLELEGLNMRPRVGASRAKDKQWRGWLLFILILPLVYLGFQRTGEGSEVYVARWGKDPDIVRFIETNEKVVALTFDDGPYPSSTPVILDILREYNAKATFFLTGEQVKAHPDLAREIVKNGHEVANHGYSHLMMGKQPAEVVKREIVNGEKIIEEVTGVKPRYFRTPYNSYSDALIGELKARGYQLVLWSVDSRDWQRPGVEAIISRVMEPLQPGDIILFHDTKANGQTLEALRRILPQLKEQGYRCLTVGDLLNLKLQTSMD